MHIFLKIIFFYLKGSSEFFKWILIRIFWEKSFLFKKEENLEFANKKTQGSHMSKTKENETIKWNFGQSTKLLLGRVEVIFIIFQRP